MSNERIGLIDIGSNTVRLVIFETDAYYNIKELQNIKTPARLYLYLSEDKVLSQEGIDKLTEIMQSFKKVAIQYEVDTLMPVATAAIRQSKNQQEILEHIKEETGIKITLLAEEQEAYYGNYAVLHSINSKNGITIDIGGGSTEITYFENKKILHSISFPFGVVTLKELFFDGKAHNDSKAIKNAKKFIAEQFNSLPWIQNKEVPIIAIGGSARNIANIHQRMIEYPIAGVHAYQMTRDNLQDTLNILEKSDTDELNDLDGLSRDRTDIILPANLVFNALFDAVAASTFIFSNKGLREGVVMEYLNIHHNNPFSLTEIRQQTVGRTAQSYNIPPMVARQRVSIADKLLSVLEKEGIIEVNDYWENYLRSSAYLYYIGSYIDNDAQSQNTFYILSNSNLPGLNHKERVILALLASFKNKSLLKQYTKEMANWFDKDELNLLQYLGGIIKFSEALNDSHVNVVKDISLEKKDSNNYTLHIVNQGDVLTEEYRTNRQKKHLERILDANLAIKFTESTQ
ncbi:Ppx/GppA family phosphatase [Desemzia sp. FAM 23989]|uniref:Ppx/GppA phosphatase family protein n=1 Tax=Desemzia sp. FAM 23989 TaxID=3259523 RepID=UPI0038852D16